MRRSRWFRGSRGAARTDAQHALPVIEAEPGDGRSMSPAACTIVAGNYLAQAGVLIDSYLAHHPGARFYLLVVDDVQPGISFPPSVTVLGPDDLRLPCFREMSFKYEVTELCTALKPSLLLHVLTERDEPNLVFFDPDIMVFRPLDELWALLATSNVVLLPHLLDPIPLDGRHPDEQDILAAGAYNLGFLGVNRSTETQRLLTWWQERLEDRCRVDVAHGLFVDQKWMDLVPSLFPSTSILRDDTYDVAYRNLHSRALGRCAECVNVNGRPLAFFHFSGYDPAQPRALSRHQTRLTVVEGSALAHLLESYSWHVFRHGYESARRRPYGYSRFANGIGVSTVHRHLYRQLDATRRAAFGDPFAVQADGSSFYEWCRTPSAQTGGASPLLEQVLNERSDVLTTIPDPLGTNRDQFLAWAATDGARELRYDPLLVGLDTPHSDEAPAPSAHCLTIDGVNVIGYLRNETGLGTVARGFVGALRAAGCSTCPDGSFGAVSQPVGRRHCWADRRHLAIFGQRGLCQRRPARRRAEPPRWWRLRGSLQHWRLVLGAARVSA
jgi:hypothetical protein